MWIGTKQARVMCGGVQGKRRAKFVGGRNGRRVGRAGGGACAGDGRWATYTPSSTYSPQFTLRVATTQRWSKCGRSTSSSVCHYTQRGDCWSLMALNKRKSSLSMHKHSLMHLHIDRASCWSPAYRKAPSQDVKVALRSRKLTPPSMAWEDAAAAEQLLGGGKVTKDETMGAAAGQ